MPLISVPVLLDPIITLRLLHHWILSRKISIQQQQQQVQQQQQQQQTRNSNSLSVADVSSKSSSSSVLVVSNKAPPLLRIRRELSLPNNDERTTSSSTITRLEAQLLPNVNVLFDYYKTASLLHRRFYYSFLTRINCLFIFLIFRWTSPL